MLEAELNENNEVVIRVNDHFITLSIGEIEILVEKLNVCIDELWDKL